MLARNLFTASTPARRFQAVPPSWTLRVMLLVLRAQDVQAGVMGDEVARDEQYADDHRSQHQREDHPAQRDERWVAVSHGAVMGYDTGAFGVEPRSEGEQRRQTGADDESGDDDLQHGGVVEPGFHDGLTSRIGRSLGNGGGVRLRGGCLLAGTRG